MKKPNWKEWYHTPEVSLWQACALSLDIDPHSMKHHPQGWMAGPGGGPIFTDDTFPSEAVKEEYELRLRVLKANIVPRGSFSRIIFDYEDPHMSNIRLAEFASWALSVVEWEDLPPEFVELAQKPNKQTNAPAAAKVEDVSTDTPADDDQDETLAALFDLVPVEALAKTFPTDNESTSTQWKKWAEKAKANGLIYAREKRAMFNPYKAGKWFVRNGAEGWDDGRLYRVLAKILPARSRDDAHLLTGGLE